jgi:SAM-dependent methyltransferase
VALAVARRSGLPVSVLTARADSLRLPDSAFHFAVVNNAICYIVDPAARRSAFAELRRVLLPGGWLVIRDPNRLTPVDPFTDLPLVAVLPPAMAQRVTRLVGRHRSHVRLRSPLGAVREMRRAGFSDVRWARPPGRLASSRIARYHHVVARAPGAASDR